VKERLYLLDTNILLALVRGDALGERIQARYKLRMLRQRPLVAIVSHGEIWVLAKRNGWGDVKRRVLREALANLVTVDINHTAVIDTYVELDIVSQQHPDGARNMGKNDLWIAACARAAGAMLLTTDDDFEHLVPNHLDAIVISRDE
jgi:tRNA(fMet)-specific endonuclease VapC